MNNNEMTRIQKLIQIQYNSDKLSKIHAIEIIRLLRKMDITVYFHENNTISLDIITLSSSNTDIIYAKIKEYINLYKSGK